MLPQSNQRLGSILPITSKMERLCGTLLLSARGQPATAARTTTSKVVHYASPEAESPLIYRRAELCGSRYGSCHAVTLEGIFTLDVFRIHSSHLCISSCNKIIHEKQDMSLSTPVVTGRSRSIKPFVILAGNAL